MKDLSGLLEIFVITNGRDTFDYAMQALSNQTIKCRISTISDRAWVEANNFCATSSESKFFLRVDDDMFLHPQSIAFIANQLSGMDECVMKYWRLWETHSRSAVNGVKAYRTDFARKVGFRANHLGKIDKNFIADIRSRKAQFTMDKSIVGVHAASDLSSSLRYLVSRGENSDKKHYKKKMSRIKVAINSAGTLQEQYNFSILGLPQINDNARTRFAKFLHQ